MPHHTPDRPAPPRSRRPHRSWLPFAALALAAGGCARPAGVIFEPLDSPLRWPAPPDPARIDYVGALDSSDDLKPARPFFQGLGEALFGREPARSMLSPYGISSDGQGRLFVADSNGQVLHVFDLEARTYAQWRPGVPGTEFAQPVAVAWDPAGRVLVADSVAATIHAFDDRGGYLGPLGQGLLARPCGIAIDPARDRLYVADAGTHELVVLDRAGRLQHRLGGRGTAPGQFNYPTHVAVDGTGRIFVSDSLNFRVQVFDAELSAARQIGAHGDRPGYFSQPKGVAIDSENHLYVVDAHFEAVQIFRPDGTVLLSFGEEGTGPGQFWLPAGIHIDVNDRIWIADSYNRRIQVFDYRPEVGPTP